MRLIMLPTLLLTAGSAASPAADALRSSHHQEIKAHARAIDGDTVSIDIRLFGVDAIERKQLCRTRDGCWPCGKAAQDYASRLLKSGDATIRLTGKKSYSRPIGTVSIDGADLGERMIAAGFAIPVPDFLRNDPSRASRYVAAYDRAVREQVGVHTGYFIEPAKWRRGARLSCEPARDPQQ